MNSEQHALPATTQAQQEEVNTGQSGRPSYPGGLTTATSLGNVGSTPHSSADLRVGTAVALASSVAKYWVLTNLFPGPLPQVSVYHHPHHNSSHRSGGGGEAPSKESASSLSQEMALASSSHHQTTSSHHHHHQPSVSSNSHHNSLQSNAQIPVSLPGLTLEGTHIPASVSHLQAAHAQMQQQMQSQQQQLHQQQQSQQQQPIILPSQLLNIKTLHGLKVIPTPAGLKTTGAAVYARVIAPTTMQSAQSSVTQSQPLQTQPPRNSPYGTP